MKRVKLYCKGRPKNKIAIVAWVSLHPKPGKIKFRKVVKGKFSKVQAELMAVVKAMEWLKNSNIPKRFKFELIIDNNLVFRWLKNRNPNSANKELFDRAAKNMAAIRNERVFLLKKCKPEDNAANYLVIK